MTHEEFVGKLIRFFSMEQINTLENFGYESAFDTHKGMDITEEDMRFIGRDFVCNYLWDAEDVEEINAILPDNNPMPTENFMNMLDMMDAYGHDEW